MSDRQRGPWRYPGTAAHRGAGKLAPENTLAAIRLGRSFGFRMIEVDAKLSGDGVAFLLHDATLDRTTNGRGRADLPWSELARLDAGSWHSAAHAGEPVPTLAAVARWCVANGVACNVEIKPMPGRERETGAAVALDALALWEGSGEPPVLSSFSPAALQAAREVAPRLPRGHLFDAGALPSDWPDRLERLDCLALDCHHSDLTADVVALAHRQGFAVMTYTVNDPGDVARLREWGVDCIITDAVDRIAPD
jgi:glycerophosphoryl diester phosphodiesterase